MTAPKCFEFGKSTFCSDVKRFVYFVVLLSILDSILCDGMQRESKKLFGGYRITPAYCKATRAAKYNRGSTICMFNHECVQRGGEVVGACMDGFLFGACCQLKSESQSHIPKGPGVVMTSYLDYPEADPDSDDYESEQQLNWHNSFKPIVTPGYRPGDKTRVSTEKTVDMELPGSTESSQSELISEGLTQITNTLLDTPPKDNNFIHMKPKPDFVYTYSSIDHSTADTILVNKNGSDEDDIARPSDFNIHISSMQTKPTVVPESLTSTSTTPKTVSTHHPVFSKPVFKPKPKPEKTATTTEKYVPVQTVTKITELSSINSIIQMLNESTPSLAKIETTTPSVETKSSPTPSATVEPVSYSSGYPSTYLSTGHYVTLKPSANPSVTILSSSTVGYATTSKPSYATTSKPYATTTKPSYATTSKPSSAASKPTYASTQKPTKYTSQTNKKPVSSSAKPTLITAKPTGKPGTLKPLISSLKPILNSVRPKPSSPKPYTTSSKPSYTSPQPSQSTSQAIDAFNRYPTNPEDFGTVTTFSYVSSTTTRKPPSTSYVYSNKPTRRPVTSPSNIVPSYDIAPDTFSSVTPTVIVLNGFQSTKAPEKEPTFVEISQEPFKKPVNQITVNNHIEATNNIYMNKPQLGYDRPSSPTVVITPKPSPTTTPYPAKPHKPTNSVSISSVYTTNSGDDYNDFSATTNKPEMQTSPDDLINFPPVRNPMLNATGSNPGLYNTSISLSDNDLEVLHDVEFTTPTWQEDDKLNEKMNLFVNKIVGSLQGTFQELHDIVILDKKPNTTYLTRTTTQKPLKKTPATTRRPLTTSKKPSKLTTTKKPLKTTKKPTKLTTAARRPTTTAAPAPTTTAKRPDTTTKKSKPIKKVTTTQATSTATEADEVTTESLVADSSIDYNDKDLCGVRPLVKSGRIVGGKNARFGEWPWQVLVRESTWLGLFTKNKCGGVLITSRFVTTAAHCQPGFLASLVAVFGENDISGDLEPRRPVSRNVRRVIVHRQYDAATFENDLALLELDTPVKFDAHIVPICMPPDEAEFTGRLATVTGWGRLKYGGGVPAVLQAVQVPVIENAMCQEMFQKAGHTKIILNSFLCAGYANGQKDSCEGDSGGPLVTQREDGRYQLVGTVSHGIKCAAPYLPGVYMRTTFYKPWLRSITGVH